MGKSDPYCTCEIAGKPHTQLKTKVIDDTLDPVWNHTSSMGGYAVGDSLEFAVWDSDSFKSDDLLGRATLSSSRFQDACFDGELELREAGKNIKAFLRVRVALVGNDLQPPAPTSKPLPPAPTSVPLPKPPSPAPKSVATPLPAAPAPSPKQPSSPPKPLSTPTTPAAPATLPKPSPAPKPSPTTPPASKPSPTPQTASKPSPTLPPASKPTPTPPPAPSTSKPIIQRKPQQKPKPTPGAARQEPRKRNWSDADPKKWVFADVEYGGSYSYANGKEPQKQEVKGPIAEGLATLHAKPAEYDGLFHQSNMPNWPPDQQKYTLVMRTGSGFSVREQAGGGFTWVAAKYQDLPGDMKILPDRHTDSLLATFGGQTLSTLAPGRGVGCADVPFLKIVGQVDPSDIAQGGVGDCWLLSAISALAEYSGAIERLFRKTQNIHKLPADTSNMYTVSLYDVASWVEVDVLVDERLCGKSDSSGLLGCHPSVDGELWVCYLEKAVAAHCGGWDKLQGGTCVHAWRILTGCKEQYSFHKDDAGTGKFRCSGTLNPNTEKWETLANSPHDGFRGLWPMPWPEVGGGGGLKLALGEQEMFERMCAWDDANYIMACGTRKGSDKEDHDGIVDGHAYTILSCIDNAGGTEFDMIKVRNPWGHGEFSSGMWDDDGPGWDKYPDVKAACNPVQADDGIFWVDAAEFFKYFETIYLCACDISKFVA
ncbi:unnamed protein product [Polarella glacialis]|uniref:Calpain catalytic domain-containing protein n=1 Tax=Polarella glacialis TaxID=89957 RepID=A0A813DCT6_POLGL|nr:unnamed protein product [Polarella glacialis]